MDGLIDWLNDQSNVGKIRFQFWIKCIIFRKYSVDRFFAKIKVSKL